MPRLECDAMGCSKRPILAIPASLVAEHIGSGVTCAGGTRLGLHGYARLCRGHAAACGVEQLQASGSFWPAAAASSST